MKMIFVLTTIVGDGGDEQEPVVPVSSTPDAPEGQQPSEPVGNQPVAVDAPETIAGISVSALSEQEVSLLRMVEANPAIQNTPDVKAFMDEIKKKQAAAPATPPATPATPAEDGDEPDEPATPEPTGGIFDKSKQPVVGTLQDMASILGKKLSMDLSTQKGLTTLVSSIETWRNDSQKLTDVQKKLEDYEASFEKMPVAITAAIAAWAKGSDWQSEFNGNLLALDFSKTYEEQSPLGLLNHYFKDEEYTEDDIKNNDPAVKKVLSAAKVLFEKDRESVEQVRVEAKNQAEQIAAVHKNSVNTTVQTLRAEFPGFDDAKVKAIRNTLLNKQLGQLFYDKNGSLKPDAAKRLAFALYGEDYITQREAAAEKRGKSKANEEKAATGSTTPNTASQNAGTRPVSGQMAQQLQGWVRQTTY